jgi:hypothetical protein
MEISLPISLKVPPMILGIVILASVSGAGQVRSRGMQTPSLARPKDSPQATEIPPCTGSPIHSPSGHAPSQISPHPHSVTLSWNATVPTSSSPRDAIKGYSVYRSLTSHIYAESNRISESLVRGTQCVDSAVRPRKTYFYAVRAVTEEGRQSTFSIEIKAVVPFP